LNYFHPVAFSNEVTFALGFGFVDENGSLVEGGAVCTNRIISMNLFLKILFLINSIAGLKHSFHKESYTHEFVKFINQNLVLFFKARLKVTQDCQDKNPVLMVFPDVATVFSIFKLLKLETGNVIFEKFIIEID